MPSAIAYLALEVFHFKHSKKKVKKEEIRVNSTEENSPFDDSVVVVLFQNKLGFAKRNKFFLMEHGYKKEKSTMDT